MTRILLPLLVTLALPVPAMARGRTSTSSPRPRVVNRIEPALRAWFVFPAYRLFRAPQADRMADAVFGDRIGVSIRMTRPEVLRDLVAREGRDLQLERRDGRVVGLGRIVAARATARGLDLLESVLGVERVELDLARPRSRPLDHTRALIQADDVWRTLDGAGLPVTGAGVIIADIDSGIDVMHPMFFRLDPDGYRDWIDVNGNGRLDPGVDAIDLDGDGVAGPDETLGYLEGVAWDFATWEPMLGTGDGQFDPGWDYLFVDANRDGVRSFGPDAGYVEADPTYGERLVVVDDVNGDGQVDPGEKLVLLGASKIRAVFNGRDGYLRGDNLIEAPVSQHSLHGTGVSGILVGGNRGFGPLVGIAPEAELLLADDASNPNPYASMLPLLQWAVAQGAHVMLHEYAPWAGTHLDGSTNHEAIMDEAAADYGIAQVNPAGNLGGAEKHCRPHVARGGGVAVPVEVPPDPGWGDPYSFLELTFHWREPDRDLRFVLTTPSGEAVDLGTTGTPQNGIVLADGTTMIWAYRDDSARGTAMFDIWAFGQEGQSWYPIENGVWTLDATDPGPADASALPVELSGYVMDNVTSWDVGARFLEAVSEEHLVCFPATADSAIAVAAYTGHAGAPYSGSAEAQGELRRYSGRGTRVDGVSLIDVAAPDNPITALSRADYGYGYEIELGAYLAFGGTSGAGPHVAGAAALLKQVHPGLDGLAVRQAIRDGALVDTWVEGDGTHGVADLWGAGKLRAYQAIYQQSPAPNTAPTINVAPITSAVGYGGTAIPVEVSDAEDPIENLQLLWDQDYDGTWDGSPLPATESFYPAFDATGIKLVKVRVVDTGGLTAEALAQVTVVDAPVGDAGVGPGPDAGPGPGGGGDGCACRTGGAAPAAWPFLILAAWLLRRRRRR
jgi:MYXO-CTERM domain-containing protein